MNQEGNRITNGSNHVPYTDSAPPNAIVADPAPINLAPNNSMGLLE